MSKTQSKLDRLNKLLARDAKRLELPPFRSYVSTSGANQDWLVKALKRHDNVDAEILELLNTKLKHLLVDYAPASANESSSS